MRPRVKDGVLVAGCLAVGLATGYAAIKKIFSIPKNKLPTDDKQNFPSPTPLPPAEGDIIYRSYFKLESSSGWILTVLSTGESYYEIEYVSRWIHTDGTIDAPVTMRQLAPGVSIEELRAYHFDIYGNRFTEMP